MILFWVLASIYPLLQVSELTYNFDTSALSPESSAEKRYYEQFQSTFNIDGEYLAIAFINENGIFKREFLESCQLYSDSLKNLNYHTEFISPLDLRLTVNKFFSVRSEKLIHLNNPEWYLADSSYIFSQPDFVPALFSEDGTAFSISLKLRDEIDSEQLFIDLENLKQHFGLEQIALLGKDAHKKELESKLKSDVWKTALLASVLCILLLLVFYRNLLLSLILAGITFLASAWSYGLMAMNHIPVNTLTSMIPAIVLCIALADLVHFNQTFRHYLRAGVAKVSALKQTLKEISKANLITSASTSLGFLTLLLSGSKAFGDFAIFITLGIAIAFIISISLFPAILYFIPEKLIIVQKRSVFPFIKSSRFNKNLILLFLIGLISFVPFSFQNNYLLNGQGDSNQLSKDSHFFDENFGGLRSVELNISIPDALSAKDENAIEDLSEIQTYLKDTMGLKKVYSVISMLKSANRSLYFGTSNAYKIPDNRRDKELCYEPIFSEKVNPPIRDFVTADEKEVRIVAFGADLGSNYYRKQNKNLFKYLDTNFAGKGYEWRVTGFPQVLDKSAFHFTLKIVGSLILGLLIVLLVIQLLYHSWTLSLAAMISNIVPLLLFNAVLVLFDIGYDFTVTTILIISFGMAVDDTIHFTNRYMIEIKSGRNASEAIENTFQISGKAIWLTSILLIAGFGSLGISSFEITRMFGLFTALVLLFALFSDLLLLPYLIKLFSKD